MANEEQEEGQDLGPIRVAVEKGRVVVLFSRKIASFSLPPKQARKMAKALKQHASEAEQMDDETET